MGTRPGYLGIWYLIINVAWYGLLYTLFPLVIYLSFTVTSPSLLYHPTNPRYTNPIHSRWYSRYILISCLVYHTLDTIMMGIAYGTIATIVSPGRTWILIWAYYIFFKSPSCKINKSKSD
jgi:hypothetical protein